VSSDGIKALAALTQLKFLGLDFTRTSKRGLEPLLQALPNLKLLNLSNSKISKKSIRYGL
jgi:Leucine-rich repeat (LRR) protein